MTREQHSATSPEERDGRPDRREGGRAPGDSGGGGNGESGARKVLAWAGAAAAALLVLYLGAAVALRTLVPPETLARWAEPRAEAALNRNVEIGGAELTIFPHLGVALEDLTVGNLAEFKGPPVVSVERAELRVALLPLVRGDVEVDEAVARGLDLRLQVDEEGDSSFGDLVPATGDTADAGSASLPVSLAVRSVGVENASVEYRDRRSGRLVRLSGLDARGSLARADGSWDIGGNADVGELTAALPSVRESPFRSGSVRARLRMSAGAEFDWLEIREGSVAVGGVPLSLTGRVDSFAAPVRELSLALAADSLRLASLAETAPAGALPESVESLEGLASLRLEVTGPAGGGRVPEVGGLLRLRDAGATLSGRGRVARGLSGTLRAAGDTLHAEGLEGTLLGGPFRLTGRMALDSARAFTARVESTVSVASLVPEGAGPGTSGSLAASLELSGRASRLSATSARGSVEVSDLLLLPDSPRAEIRVPSGAFRFRGQSISWTGLPVLVGGDRLTTAGRLERWGGVLAGESGRPGLRGRVEGARLDLGKLLPQQEEDAPTYGQLVFARLGRDSLRGRSAGDLASELGYVRPSSLPAVGEVELSIDTLLFDPYRFEPATARLEFGPDLIRISSLELGLFGGRLEQALSLSVGGESGAAATDDGAGLPFSVTLTGSGLRAADFLATTSPLGRLLTGTLSLELEAAGRLDGALLPVRDSLVGRGRLTTEGGGLAGNAVTGAVASLLGYPALRSPSVKRLVAPFRIQGGRVRFDTARLATAAGGVRWSGSLGLGGDEVDLGAQLEVPRGRLSEINLQGAGIAGDLLSRLQQGEGPLQLGLALGGTLSAPTVGLDTDALRARAKEATRGAAEEAVEKRIEQGRGLLEKRGRGLLRRLTGREDTAAADTVRPDTARAAPDTTVSR